MEADPEPTIRPSTGTTSKLNDEPDLGAVYPSGIVRDVMPPAAEEVTLGMGGNEESSALGSGT